MHTTLNREPGGVPVKNARGDTWNLSGDDTLNDATRKIARRAVAQSQLNVLSVHGLMGPVDVPAAFARVWAYTPRPTPEGTALIRNASRRHGSTRSSLVDAVAGSVT